MTLFEELIQRNITVATAESCTGGNIAAAFVSQPGISRVFLAGLVTYANSAKESILGVREETIENFGAVSAQCALEMLAGAQRATGAECTVCTTGIAGPDGGTDTKPVGLVYVGVRRKGRSMVRRCLFSGSREEIIRQATEEALRQIASAIKA